MGFCSFIMLEPNTARSAEAFGNIQHIFQGGALKGDEGKTTFSNMPAEQKEVEVFNALMALVNFTGHVKKLAGIDLLGYELKSVFEWAGESPENKQDQSFYDKYFAAYFYKLAKSGNMAAFTRLIGSSADKDGYAKWVQNHSKEVADLDNWVKNTERSF